MINIKRFSYNQIVGTLLVVLGLAIHLAIIIPSGSYYCFSSACGLAFWGAHGHDGLWNLAIAEASFTSFPPALPTYAGAVLKGYNYLLDLGIMLLNRISSLPTLFIYFKLLPLFWAIGIVLLLRRLANTLAPGNHLYRNFLYASVFFISPFAVFFRLYHYGTIWDSSTLLPTPQVHLMTNFHFAFAILGFLYTFLLLRTQQEESLSPKLMLQLLYLTLLTFGLKFYTGVALAILVSGYILTRHLALKQKIASLLLYTLFVILSLLLWYLPDRHNSGAFIWSPFSIFNKITEEPSQFYLETLTNARYTLETSPLGPRLAGIYLLNTLLFIFFNLGLRSLGLLYLFYLALFKRDDRWHTIFSLVVLFCIAMPMFFIQRDDWWNTMQFFDVAVFILGLYTASASYHLWQAFPRLRLSYLILFIFSALPLLDVLRLFLFRPPTQFINVQELVPLRYLSTLPKGIVHIEASPESVRDTAYVTALSTQPSYLANPRMVGNLTINYHPRLALIKTSPCLVLNQVSYLYFVGDLDHLTARYTSCRDRLTLLQSHPTTQLYQVMR